MAKYGLFMLVFCFIISTNEVHAASMVEILFNTLSGRLDTFNRSLEILNERFDKLEELFRTHEVHTDHGEGEDERGHAVQAAEHNRPGSTDLRNTKLQVMKTMSTEKLNLRLFIRGFETQFDDFKHRINSIVYEVKDIVIKSNESLVSKMEHNSHSVNEQFTDIMAKINAVKEEAVSKEDDIVSQVHNMQERVTTIEDGRSFRAEQMKTLNASINLFNNFTDGRINKLSEEISTLHARKVAFTVTFSSTRQYGKGSILVFDHEVYHYGSSYSTSTGKFTAPTSGTYLFTLSVEGTHTKPAFAMLSDDKFYRMGAVSSKGEDVTGSNTCVFYMEKGTHAWIVSQADCQFFMYRTTFTGVLLG